jgi:hypothetical protein
MIYQFVAALVQALGGRGPAGADRSSGGGTYIATVEAEGPLGVQLVDARPSGSASRN